MNTRLVFVCFVVCRRPPPLPKTPGACRTCVGERARRGKGSQGPRGEVWRRGTEQLASEWPRWGRDTFHGRTTAHRRHRYRRGRRTGDRPTYMCVV